MNSFTVFSLWFLNLIVDTGGHLAFKVAAVEHADATSWRRHWQQMLRRPWLWLGVTCFVVEFFIWLAFLSVVPLAQGVLLGMSSIVAVMLCGRIWFGERLTPMRLWGVSLIVLGVVLVGVGAT